MNEFLTLKKTNCKNCYKCIRHCPVKSIRFSGNQANIVGDECILCGSCYVVCPQNARQITSEVEKVQVFLDGDAPVYASVAPSFISALGGRGIEAVREALEALGFAGAEETAVGATIVKREYDRLLEAGGYDVLISTCCHSVNLMVQKYFPSVIPYLAPVKSPMLAHGDDIKRRYPGSKVVFIGPCIAKKDEAVRSGGIIDAVLTYDELESWLSEAGVDIPERTDSTEESRARLFPVSGGIIKTMDCRAKDYTYVSIDGPESCIEAIRDIEAGRIKNCFVEMSMCRGSCVGGPVTEKKGAFPISGYAAVASYAGAKDFAVEQPDSESIRAARGYLGKKADIPSETEILSILRQMGKTRPEQELNCGTCGYDTCRDKAIAIYQGKADISMCLPFLKDKAESFSDNIINNTPNGIIVLNEELEVQQINRAALKIMNIHSQSDVMGEPVVRLLDPNVFLTVKNTGRSVRDSRVYLAEYDRYVEETVIYDKEYRIIICIMRDVSDEETEREKKEEISRQTLETADRVVDKQMRIVQEIASLLGETAAETKIALMKLKESVSDE